MEIYLKFSLQSSEQHTDQVLQCISLMVLSRISTYSSLYVPLLLSFPPLLSFVNFFYPSIAIGFGDFIFVVVGGNGGSF